jgi:hypothetical protein
VKSLTQAHRRALLGAVVILMAALVAIAPQLVQGNSCGHDFNFHLLSWLDAQSSWRQGVLYPHWTPSANFGAGEPRFIFYPPMTWMLGAALGLAMPWQFVPMALTWLMLAATGLATRALARQKLGEGAATLAGCAALFSGYTLFTAYERSAFGELSGGFWIPLLLLFILRDRTPSASAWKRAFDGSALPLALVMTGVWLSNVPLGVMASYLLAAVALTTALLQRSWAPVVRGFVGATLGIGLASFYLVPATWEQRWVDIRQAIDDPGLLIENSWLFAHHANPMLELHDVELRRVSILAVTMIAITLGGVLVCWLRGNLKTERRWWIPLALIPLAILFLQFSISLPVWNALPKLRFLQFPWRWLVVLEAPMAIFFAAAVWCARRWRRAVAVAACTLLFVACSVVAGRFFFQVCDDEDSVQGTLDVYHSGDGFEGTYEYEPQGADTSLLASNLPVACLTDNPATLLGQGAKDTIPAWSAAQSSCQATFGANRNVAGHLRIRAVTRHAGYLVLRLRSYPAWRATVNGRPVTSLPWREDGLMAVPVPQGPVNLAVDWTTTRDVIAGRWLSAFALLLLTGLGLFERKFSRSRLS